MTPETPKVRDNVNKANKPDSLFINAEKIKFAHESEKEFARILDFYRIRWEYEPKTFLLEWDSEGSVIEAFSPDFFLPDQNLYVELTTQKPRQAWKKSRKIRRMKELYPDINIRLIDKKGFESLLRKHSIEQDEGEGN